LTCIIPTRTAFSLSFGLTHLLSKLIVRRLSFILLLLCGLAFQAFAAADTFKLTTGDTLVGEALLASANDQGIQIKVGEGQYERVPWSNFSQEDLKKFAQTKKIEPLVEPFIEVTQEDKIKKTEVNIKQPERLPHPPSGSLLGAMASSGPGLVMLLLLYAANIYAGFEVAVFRGHSMPLVCGVSAVLPVIGPIIFLSMKTKVESHHVEPTWEIAGAAAAPSAAAADAGNPMQGAGEHPAGLKLAHTEEAAAPAHPPTQVFQRGQFTFNRRFFETKFPGFFGVVRRDADKDMVLSLITARGEFPGQRISRIAANDLHLQVQKGHATEEVMIPFTEIKEIRLRHKDAKE